MAAARLSVTCGTIATAVNTWRHLICLPPPPLPHLHSQPSTHIARLPGCSCRAASMVQRVLQGRHVDTRGHRSHAHTDRQDHRSDHAPNTRCYNPPCPNLNEFDLFLNMACNGGDDDQDGDDDDNGNEDHDIENHDDLIMIRMMIIIIIMHMVMDMNMMLMIERS